MKTRVKEGIYSCSLSIVCTELNDFLLGNHSMKGSEEEKISK